MGLNIWDFKKKEWEPCLEWENILALVTSIMGNGESMPKMVLEFSKIKKQDIAILEVGKKTKKMDLEDNKLWVQLIKEILSVTKNKVLEY